VQLLKEARDRAGLTQRELARRAGTSQAMVARIERGQQSPSVATLERLVRACGLELRVETSGGDAPPAGPAALTERLLVWRSGGAAYAFPLAAVERIAEHRSLVRLPGQPPGAGVVTVDGQATTAVDAADRLGIDDSAPAQIVVVRTRDGRRAVVVDRAEAVADETAIVPAPAGAGAARYVVGLADVDGDRVVVLDPDGFCA
jgi:transcriptional regulator with XRE-family HTH domain